MDREQRKTIIAETTLEIQRLDWSYREGREYLMNRYDGKRGRTHLSDEELLDFLNHLKSLK